MNYRIVSDSSSNVFAMSGAPYATVPMKIIAQREYVDAPGLDLPGMLADLRQHKGKSGSSCPNVQEWLDAFGDAENVFGITITKYLSGSYNAARQAGDIYMEEHPGRRVYIFDSLAAGPELMMIAEKIQTLAESGAAFDQVVEQVLAYHNHTHTFFCLRSMLNLARNGRVNPAVAKIADVLNIRVAGEAKGGQIALAHKPRGDKKMIQTVVEMMQERGLYDGALVRIAHCFNESAAQGLEKAVQAIYPKCRFILEPTTALCSFYAEEGGLIIGFEGAFNTANSNLEF